MDEWRKKVNDNSRDRKIIKSENAMSKYKEHWYKMVSQKIKDNGIIESNSLIAQFMGYSIDDKNEFFYGLHYYKMDADSSDKTYDQLTIENVRSHTTDGFVWNYTDFTERRYDNHWDVLMEVIEKIESFGMEFSIVKNVVVVKGTLLWHPTKKHPINVDFEWKGSLSTDTKFNACYWAVKEYVKFHNKVINN